MRVFYRSAPALLALSVALAGCGQADPPAAKNSTPGSVTPAADITASVATMESDEVCLTVEGMH